MNLQTLEKTLIENGAKGWYLNGGLLGETYTLGKTAAGWEVYYSERSQKTGLKLFRTEEEACRYFLDTMLPGLRV